MPTYSPEFKEAVIARMLPPGSESMNHISRETAVAHHGAQVQAGRWGGTARTRRGPGAAGAVAEPQVPDRL